MDSGAFEAPISGFERRALRLDSVAEVAGLVVPKNTDPAQFDALPPADFRTDDRLPLVAALTHPEASAGSLDTAPCIENRLFEAHRSFTQDRRHGIVNRRCGDSDQQRNDDGRRN